MILSVISAGAIAGGGYLLASTAWLSDFATPAPAAPDTSSGSLTPKGDTQGAQAQQPEGTRPAPLPGDAAGTRDSHDTPHDLALPQGDPNHQGSQDATSSAESSALSGLDARNLRDQGITAYKAANYSDAVKFLEESISISSDDPVAQYQLGLSYMAVQGQDHALDDAELAFRTAISLQPRWAAPYQMMAETLMRRGYYELAVPPALQATQLDPTMGDAWMTLGRAYSGAGNQAEATRAFAEAAKYAPAPPETKK
jgi:Flp pilus assembly protein TadD